jgi:pyrroloquinoline-quinone synthase
MNAIELQSELVQVVEVRMATSEILNSHYFVALRNQQMPRHAFEDSQKQFYFAVRFFSRAMAALAARIPDSAARMPLIQNLAEEHGLADCDDSDGPVDSTLPSVSNYDSPFRPSLAHDQTFQTFLGRLVAETSGSRSEVKEHAPVRAFNLALWAACAVEHPSVAFACLGAIEYSFAEISALIGNSIVDRGWMDRDRLVHYKLHAEIDKRHAGDFFIALLDDWRLGQAGRERVHAGLDLGFYLFKRLYDDLLTEALHAQG